VTDGCSADGSTSAEIETPLSGLCLCSKSLTISRRRHWHAVLRSSTAGAVHQRTGRIWVYNKRGTAEQWIKEGKQAAHWTRLSCHRFRANEVRLQLSVLAYNLGNLWRRLVLPTRIDTWSLNQSRGSASSRRVDG
jgi:DDE family transposase